MPVLSIKSISKTYGTVRALNGVTFDIPEQSVFGVLGPNGSGKTTLLAIVLSVLLPDAGSYAWLNGMQPEAARRELGALLETPNFYHYLNADENLKIHAAIKGRGQDDISRVLQVVGLSDRRKSKFSTFSLGMKQRLAIGSALLGKPKVLVLDEPANGLDPAGIAEMRTLVRQLHQEGITVIMASHILDEVEKVCTHVAILKKGDLLVSGSVDEVLRQQDIIEVQAQDLNALQRLLQSMPAIGQVQVSDGMIQISTSDAITTTSINAYCIAHGITLSHLSIKKKSLEAKFMELTERPDNR